MTRKELRQQLEIFTLQLKHEEENGDCADNVISEENWEDRRLYAMVQCFENLLYY